MAEEQMLNNYSDDSKIKEYIMTELMPRVFHDIPLNVLNTGLPSIINEYMSQAIEQMAFTSSFYFNESFITKAVLADSIYSEAAIFNIGYSFATPSSCMFLLELKIEDIFNNAVDNANTGLKEFILDKDTKFNLSNGSVYSLDYDILIQYKNEETSVGVVAPAWNVQYTNREVQNYCAKNKNTYITYRVADPWLCLIVQASEYERQTHVVTNNMSNGIPNADTVITCDNHICGFDVKYIDGNGNEQFLARDHILPIHSDVSDNDPYVHYIMDNPQTIRFMWQLNGTKYFVPSSNSSYEITIYTCHGEAANFTAFKNDEQPLVITAANTYSNNANVMKAAFVISGSTSGTNIGTTETVRRETIEAYNTANVLSTDHDIEEYFKTFYFKNILYPYFFKRRDDPWGRIWSGFIALKDDDDYIFRTNTIHGFIPYNVLYSNNDNTVGNNEIIIPPGWVWTYTKGSNHLYTVTPYTMSDSTTIETADTLASINEKFIFANPFGVRIQKSPFAIGYFNPWINDYVTTTKISTIETVDTSDDISKIYHATPITTNVKRTFAENYYNITTYISPTISSMADGSELVKYVKQNAAAPTFVEVMWSYFRQPLDLFTSDIPILPLTSDDGSYIPFNPKLTFLCVKEKNKRDDGTWALKNIWIEDHSDGEPAKTIFIPITGDITMLYGTDDIWGDDGIAKEYTNYVSGNTEILLYPEPTESSYIQFERIQTQNYYEMRISEDAVTGVIDYITVSEMVETELTKYGESQLYKIGKSYAPTVELNVHYEDGSMTTYTITNAANIYMPYGYEIDEETGMYKINMSNVGASGIILYADMKPAPEAGAVDYYRMPFSEIPTNEALFYIANKLLPVDQNNMRVVLHAMLNGSETGRVEMQPISRESDGTYRFEARMYPLNQMVDIDNRINIASIESGGGNWIPTVSGTIVNIDATEPELKISIFIKSDDQLRDSEVEIGDSYTGYRIIDEYTVDDLTLVQELKEMRSVVDFGEAGVPTEEQYDLYNEVMSYIEYDSSTNTLWNLRRYAYNRAHDFSVDITFAEAQVIARTYYSKLVSFQTKYKTVVPDGEIPTTFLAMVSTVKSVRDSSDGSDVSWMFVYSTLQAYSSMIDEMFKITNIVDGGMTVQLMPFVEYTLMMSERFESFVSSFTQVHKAMEPVIFERLDGNHYLDCKLIGTYGTPHSYTSDVDYADYDEIYNSDTTDEDMKFWPDLNIQIEFDVKLYNQALATNTINELRSIVKSYFNRITGIHTPADAISMDNNIYISHIIQQMEAHDNVAYMKFRGWYTNEKNTVNGNYMDANYQGIVQAWIKLDDMPKKELERYVPEMFVLEDRNIVINNIDNVATRKGETYIQKLNN